MRRQVAPSPSGVVFAFYFLAFLVFFCYSHLVFPPEGQQLLARFRWPFVWSNSLRLLVDYLLPVTMAAVALSYALGPVGPGARPAAGGAARGTPAFGHVMSGHLRFLIAVAVLYSFLYLGVYPEVLGNLEDFGSLSREGSFYLQQAQKAEAEGHPAAAARDYERYLVIDPDNREITERLGQLPAGPPVAEQDAPEGEAPEARYRVLTQGKQAFELLEMARGYFAREDYVSAHYYATLALRLDPARAEAARLAARSWRMIASTDLSQKDEVQQELFQDKREGYRLFEQEQYVRAYYLFRELRERHPRDPELATWLQRSSEMLGRQTFFLDEARKSEGLPGSEDLLLRNDAGDAGATEILHIGKMVSIEEGTFLQDVEVLRFGPGAALQHFSAQYGKLMDLGGETAAAAAAPAWAVCLHGVERTSREGASLPRLLAGSTTGGSPLTVLALRAGPQELPALAVGEATAASVGFLQLWRMRSRLREYGHSERTAAAEVFRRLLHPFSFLVLSLAAAAFGWGARPRSLSGRPALVGYLFVPLFPLVALFFSSLYLYAQRVAVNFLLLQLGFAACLPVFLALQGVLLFAALLLLAGQSGE